MHALHVMKLLGVIALAVGAALAAHYERKRRLDAIEHLALLDAGKVCLRCDSRDVRLDGDLVRCESCGFATSRSRLAATKVTAAMIDGVNAQKQVNSVFDGQPGTADDDRHPPLV